MWVGLPKAENLTSYIKLYSSPIPAPFNENEDAGPTDPVDPSRRNTLLTIVIIATVVFILIVLAIIICMIMRRKKMALNSRLTAIEHQEYMRLNK
jgi:hypothetical protein